MRNTLFAILILLLSSFMMDTANAQTLFTYGPYKVDKKEFLESFKKNPETTGTRQEQLQDYLKLYIPYRLKLQSALDDKLDETDAFKIDAGHFRKQLAETYINKLADVNALLNQAFERSQKDILLDQIFVEVAPDGDTTIASQKIKEAYALLQAGKNFEATAYQLSSDTAEIHIGYITVFTLPYSIENKVYALRPGQYSDIVRSKAGYHIFKNIAERPAAGMRKVQQILFTIPPGYTEAEKQGVQKTADSVYQLLMTGASFEELMRVYNLSPNAVYGQVDEITVGAYSPAFERQVFSLQHKGDLTKPFATPYGFNIIKLVDIVPVSKDESDAVSMGQLQQRLLADNRVQLARNVLIEKWKKEIHFTPAAITENTLWNYTSAFLQGNSQDSNYPNLQKTTTLYTFNNEKSIVQDWLDFLQKNNVQPVGFSLRTFQQWRSRFENTLVHDYFIAHLENFYPDFKSQLDEFNNANLIFAAMDKHVWSPAVEDSAALLHYYQEHAAKYYWKPGFSAISVTAPTKEVAEKIAAALKNNSQDWRQITAAYGNEILADSSRYENEQIPIHGKIALQENYQSVPEQNSNGDAWTFLQVVKVVPEKTPRSFAESKGFVMNDYQQMLEDKWIRQMKEKYPVKINEAVLKSL